jgi:hypothetical protein
VRSVESEDIGGLFALRLKNQNSVVVKLPMSVPSGTTLSLTVAYSGRIEPQAEDREGLALQTPRRDAQIEEPRMTAESSYLYSSRSYWYPQAPVTDYATATLRISVPASLECVASGDLEPGSPTVVADRNGGPPRRVYLYSATQPLRYLAFVVSRFVVSEPTTTSFTYPPSSDPGDPSVPARTAVFYSTLDVSVAANPRQTSLSRDLTQRAADIARFYASLVGDCPYPSFTIALIENDLPGGHSPGYFAALNQPLPSSPYVWRNDPAAFSSYPEFFVAHELAHQWWGQAVGWRNYHEQWLSEGFSQYFAALYAEHARGGEVFGGVMRQMGRWGMQESGQGPIYLGYRLGHIRGEGRVFRALAYNKAAVVLHMLRRLVGDETFFRGIQRFYRASRFRKAGTEDFRQAMETESGLPLERFFERWIYGSTLPRLQFSHRIEGSDLVLHVDQLGELFDLPLTVTIEYAGQKSVDVVIPVTAAAVERRVTLAGTLHRIDINKDDGLMAEIVKN